VNDLTFSPFPGREGEPDVQFSLPWEDAVGQFVRGLTHHHPQAILSVRFNGLRTVVRAF
jgi:hypothetical protein